MGVYSGIWQQNRILDVILANLNVFTSARITEIGFGIIANLACHVRLRDEIASKLVTQRILRVLFSNDPPILKQVFRLLSACLESNAWDLWARLLSGTNTLRRILSITSNTLNPKLFENVTDLFLVVVQQTEVRDRLLPRLMELDFRVVLVDALTFWTTEIMDEQEPERETHYIIGGCGRIMKIFEDMSFSNECSAENPLDIELFLLLTKLVKHPNKYEVGDCFVTATIVIRNMLVDAPELLLNISDSWLFLEGLLDLFAFAWKDAEGRIAIWETIELILNQINDIKLHAVLEGKADCIEEELFSHEIPTRENNSIKMRERQSISEALMAMNRVFKLGKADRLRRAIHKFYCYNSFVLWSLDICYGLGHETLNL